MRNSDDTQLVKSVITSEMMIHSQQRSPRKTVRKLGFSGKSLWDWLPSIIAIFSALLLPTILFLAGLVFTHQQQVDADQSLHLQQTATTNQRYEDVLQTYLTNMTTLLVDDDITSNLPDQICSPKTPQEQKIMEARIIAQANTLTALGDLDPTRKTKLMDFLVQAKVFIPHTLLNSFCVMTTTDIISLHDAVLNQVNLASEQLPFIDLSNADLSGANLTEATLVSSNLHNANLQGATLTGSFLSQANLSNTNLVGVDLESADIHGADLSLADLMGDSLEQVTLNNAYLAMSDFSHTDLNRANLVGCYANSANFSSASLKGARLTSADLGNVNLSGASLYGTDLQETILISANLQGADLSNANLKNADLSFADLRNTNITQQQLDSAFSHRGATLPQGLH